MQGTQKPAEEVALVAVIGASASGKSSFINAIMGPVAEVGSGNSSCTDELAKWTYDLPDGRKVTFVDTPGLNFYSETGIDRPAETTLKKLDELSSSINFPAQYLFVVHNISEDCPLQPLRYGSNRRFNSLCSRTQVHVITTHWDEVLEDEDEDPSVYEQVVAEKEELLFSEKSFFGICAECVSECASSSLGILEPEHSPSHRLCLPKGSYLPPLWRSRRRI